MYNTNIPLKEIAKEFNTHASVIIGWAIKLGCEHRQEKYSFNIHYFNELDSEEKAYWLGFIFADGYIDVRNMLGIEIHEKDKDHLYKFKESINSTHPIHTYTKNSTFGVQTLSRIMLPFNKNIKVLNNYGIYKNKTHEGCPQNIPEKYIKDFIRGLLDGDGCIHKTKYGRRFNWVSFSGNIKTLEFIMNNFQGKWYVTKRFPDKKDNIYDITLVRKNECLNFLHWLYDDVTIYLERKYKLLAI